MSSPTSTLAVRAGLPYGLFLICVPHMKLFGHFWFFTFFMLKKSYFGKIWVKLTIFKSSCVCFCWQIFFVNLDFIWSLKFFLNLATPGERRRKRRKKCARNLKLIPAFDVTTSEASDVFVAREEHYFCSLFLRPHLAVVVKFCYVQNTFWGGGGNPLNRKWGIVEKVVLNVWMRGSNTNLA